MSIASYDVGDRVRLGNHSSNTATSAITDLTGAAADPTGVTLTTREPDGTLTTYTYGGSPALLREAAGRYYVDVTLETEGLWSYRLVGTGAVVLAEEGVLNVRQSLVLAAAPPGAASGSGSYYTAAESDALFVSHAEGDAAYAELDHTHPGVTTGRYQFQTNPAMTDPGSGNLRSNTGDAATATQLAVDQVGLLGTDITTLFQAMTTNDTIYMQDLNDATDWVRYRLTGAPTINSGWAQLPVAVIASGGSIGGTQHCVLQMTLGAG